MIKSVAAKEGDAGLTCIPLLHLIWARVGKRHSTCGPVQHIFNTRNAKKIMYRFICSRTNKKDLKSYDFRSFLVEISGIEPLTS